MSNKILHKSLYVNYATHRKTKYNNRIQIVTVRCIYYIIGIKRLNNAIDFTQRISYMHLIVGHKIKIDVK
ncbi:hypothetical protein VIN01S_10070 [Vibrio inusitatus NBRC 102082]|uniref:Uncharacterized protein n=1 Tax=Vibrio inusitatus NBRC 102082 TaxID=1219070 RepID=A0A4Y3HSS6_9VIBR|nr:hypothetical protein VIN01S_10070 [Vibrio inusitatus NBRC 102082]